MSVMLGYGFFMLAVCFLFTVLFPSEEEKRRDRERKKLDAMFAKREQRKLRRVAAQ